MCRRRRWQVYRFGPQNQGGDKFAGLGLKTGDGFGAVKVWAEGTWRHREAYVEAKRSRRGGPFVRCSYKNIDCFAYTRVVSVINSVVVFLSFGGGFNDQMEG